MSRERSPELIGKAARLACSPAFPPSSCEQHGGGMAVYHLLAGLALAGVLARPDGPADLTDAARIAAKAADELIFKLAEVEG